MKNVILICIDCLRHDTFRSDTAPFLDQAACARGAILPYAYAAAPWTYPSTNTILTGMWPHHHGARHRGAYRERVFEPPPGLLDDRLPTMFSLLRARGYWTMGVSTIYWSLNKDCRYPGCDHLLRSQKQDQFYVNTRAEWVVDSFIDQYLASPPGDPFFAYLHLIDLHRPFDLEVAARHTGGAVELMEGVDDWDSRIASGDRLAAQRFRHSKRLLYEALMRYVDLELRRLIEFLVARGVFEDTLVIVTADHGEEFWEHEDFERRHLNCGRKTRERWLLGTGHGHTMFEELIHVPLIFLNPPGPLHNSAYVSPVSGADLLPTLVSWLDLGSPAFDGKSLTQDVSDRNVLCESTLYGFERKALIRGRTKVVSSPGEAGCWLYDLERDPDERHPLAGAAQPDLAAELAALHSHYSPRQAAS